MKRLNALLLLMSWILFFTQCTPGSDPIDFEAEGPLYQFGNQVAVINAQNDFGFDVFKDLHAAEPTENMFMSPMSISMAIGMLYNGAANNSASAIAETCKWDEMSINEVNQGYKGLMARLSITDPEVQFDMANAIWQEESFPVFPSFLDVNSEYYGSEVNGLPFQDPTSVDVINAWVSDKTNGKITSILEEISPEEVLFLINAIYFKANWTNEFDPAATYTGTFTGEDGTENPIDLMANNDGKFPYFENSLFQAVDMAYSDSIYSMSVLLPKSGETVQSIIEELNPENWETWMNNFYYTPLNLIMPKFEMEYKADLKTSLINLGMGAVFSASTANLSNIADDNLFVSQVKHKTFIQVDEVGTEAAAVTSIGIGITSAPPYMNINRPFLFVIRENQTGTILFMGKMMTPPEG